jgi:AbrB family looped-hinge helix DNA binding protein
MQTSAFSSTVRFGKKRDPARSYAPQSLPNSGFVPYFRTTGWFYGCAMKRARARVSKSGRLSIPAEFRKEIGLGRGGDVVVELTGREIRIRTVEEVVAQARAIARRLTAGKPDASVDAFLAERRREAERE